MHNTGVLSRAERLSLQAQWLDARMGGDPNWKHSDRKPVLFVVGEQRAFVAWRLTKTGPQILSIYRVTGIEASFTAGLTVILSSNTTSTVIKVSAHPREVLPDVYAWLPAFAEVRHAPIVFDNPMGSWHTTLPMLVRSAGSEVGAHHLTPVKEFRALWPDVEL
jgi:hypothetical protein